MPDPLFPNELLIATLLAFIGGIIRGFTGFGTPLFLAPLYALMFGPAAAVPIMILQEVGAVVQTFRESWPKTDRPEVASLLIGCAALLPVGVLMLNILDPDLVRIAMSLLTLAFVVVLWFGWRYRGPRTLPVRIGVGALSGFTAGFTGIGGPPIVLYFVSGEKSIALVRANLVIYFAGLTLIIVPLFAYLGLITLQILWFSVVLSVPLMLGIVVGTHLFRGATEQRYIRGALVVLVVSAVFGLLR